MSNVLLHVKTNHAVIKLFVLADDRLISITFREHHDGNTPAHPDVR